jgi:flagellar hook-basal body complex protein FliE
MAVPTVAANAYASLARMMESGGAEKGGQNPSFSALLPTEKSGANSGPSFSALLKDAVGSVVEAGRKSDAQTMAMTSGRANVMDVVTAVAETDVAVSTLVSVRDRVIQAYEDIMKMPI